MSDPFLWSAGNAPDDFESSNLPDDHPLRRLGFWRPELDFLPREATEAFVSRLERWSPLAAAIDKALIPLGFHRHDLDKAPGGVNIAPWLRDDGVAVGWAFKDFALYDDEALTAKVFAAMNPALEALLRARGFTTEVISAPDDDAGQILVTGLTTERE
ncbi:hypothetical protein AGRA3207_000842 [Actinomadura graeca]|uniref:Uncharacterized protein n=1 Tax=Actinomadura graeca TaxID=2750812 RepID=A0ABX8QNK6_9ACTN|nr:hypothetical protein [Actinomadura graeca]QXJ20178.1 hypothetical protein AGRA3207_000842 [Actinomadura graeca]